MADLDLRIKFTFPDHWKTDVMVSRLGEESVRCLLRLWGYAAEYRPKGKLTQMSNVAIAKAAHWPGEPDEFIAGLLESGYLKKHKNGLLVLNDWKEHQPYLYYSPERKQKAKKAAKTRWANERNGLRDAKTKIEQCSTDAGSNAPSPSPSPSPSPDPNPKERKTGLAVSIVDNSESEAGVYMPKPGESEAVVAFKSFCHVQENWLKVWALIDNPMAWGDLVDNSGHTGKLLKKHFIEGEIVALLQSESERELAALKQYNDGDWLRWLKNRLKFALKDYRANNRRPSAFLEPMTADQEAAHMDRHRQRYGGGEAASIGSTIGQIIEKVKPTGEKT